MQVSNELRARGQHLGGAPLEPPATATTVRARGFVAGGYLNGSGWFVETLIGLPFFNSQPLSRTNNAGSTATFWEDANPASAGLCFLDTPRWGKRGARVNTISPGIIITPLAKDELTGPRGAGYRRMIEVSAAGRAGTPDEVGTVGALLMGPDGSFITGSDFLMDGGVTAAYWFGELAPK